MHDNNIEGGAQAMGRIALATLDIIISKDKMEDELIENEN